MQPLDPFTMPLEGRRFIEASAGTGKTWTLTLLMLRMIVEQGLGIEQILVLTYTRAATAELRSRIRSRLREAQMQLQGRNPAPDPPDPALERVLAAVPFETASLRLNQALTRMDEAAITTIHGFCGKVIKEHAFEAGFSFDQGIIADEAALREEIMADFWRKRFYPLGPEESALVLKHWPGPEKLLATVANTLMIEEGCILPRLSADALPRQVEALQQSHGELLQAWKKDGAAAQDWLESDPCLSRAAKNYRADQVEKLLDDLAALLLNPVFPRLLPPRLERLSTEYMLDCLLKKKVCTDWQPHTFFNSFTRFRQHYQEMLYLWKCTLLHEARLYLKEELQRRKEAQRLLGYDDLLSRLDLALQNPESGPQLARALGKRYQAILVDEFQDTDPVQYRIFSALSGEGSRPFHMIGDAKQAIYSFRGGDIFTYIQAKRETAAARRYTMTTNHRSSPGMVAVVNTLFNRRSDAFVFTRDIPFHPVEPSGRVENQACMLQGRPAVPLNILLMSDCEEKKLSKSEADKCAATACAEAIAGLVQSAAKGKASISGRALVSSDIAILVQAHRQAELMRVALSRVGLNSVYASKLSVFAGSEAAELETLLRALLNPAGRSLCASALATSFFGLNAFALYQLQQDAALWGERVQQLRGYQAHWQRFGIHAMLHRLFQESGITARLTAQSEGERSLTNLLHLAELLHQEESTAPGMERLLRWLQRQREHAESDAEEERLMRLESDQALIRISTQHSAKGLEYALVFLPFLWRAQDSSRSRDAAIAFHDRETLSACRNFDSENAAHLALAEEEERAEAMRLLYVALTRARYSTCICWGRVSGMMETPMARLLHEKDVSEDEKLLRRDLAELTQDGPDQEVPLVRCYPPGELPWQGLSVSRAAGSGILPPLSPQPALAARRFQGSVPADYINSSYTSLSTGQELAPFTEEGRDSPLEAALFSRRQTEDFQHIATFPRGTQAGLCLHSLLEQIDFARPAAEQEELVRKALEQYGFDLRWQSALLAWLTNILATPLPKSCSLADLAPQDLLRELSFLFPVEDLAIPKLNLLFTNFGLPQLRQRPQLSPRDEVLKGLMKGFVDLIFRHQGRYFIVDYKSNHLGSEPGSYTKAALEACMDRHHYHLQYLLYTLALHRHLQMRLAAYHYEEHFGGVYYLFLRGMEPRQGTQGIYQVRPDFALIEALDELCRGREGADGAL
ncbi:MAG: exodeoxyribonuclease V subunit beta [bacterium]|nr:exodeoxyribonuclease V subunit beta [bacterium]